MSTAVETRDLTRQFKDFWGRLHVTAVADLNLTIPSGCIFGLLGPNGSGKTTTLKLLTGLLHPSRGTVLIHGASPRSSSARRRFGYLPEVSTLYGSLSARQNLRFFAGLCGLPRQTAQRRIDALLEHVALAGAADRPVADYSKGMQRRAGLALALLNDPDLLILDEPTAGLDPAGCRLVKDMLQARAARGKTVIISSHLLADIDNICHAVCILHNGQRIAAGTLNDLLERQDRIRFTSDALTAPQRDALQDAFRRVTGREADISHPRLALETFFFNAVRDADPTCRQPDDTHEGSPADV